MVHCGAAHVIGIYVLITPTSRAILTARNILWIVKYVCNSWNITQKWIVEK
jgi:hypothetical protein